MTFDLMKKSISLKFNLANIPTHFGKKPTSQINSKVHVAKPEVFSDPQMQNPGNTAKVTLYSLTRIYLELHLCMIRILDLWWNETNYSN